MLQQYLFPAHLDLSTLLSFQSPTMVSDVTIICIDNSESMRDGANSSTRFQAQIHAASLICKARLASNLENTVGVLVMAGRRLPVVVVPCRNRPVILQCLADLEVGGEMDLDQGILVAQSALRHYTDEDQQAKIIVFAGSVVRLSKERLETLGIGLKNDGVALDVVDFGEGDEEKSEKLDALVAAANNNDNSCIVHVPAGENALFGALMRRIPIFTNLDLLSVPIFVDSDAQLTLALTIAMEEDMARREAAARRAAEEAAAKKAEEDA